MKKFFLLLFVFFTSSCLVSATYAETIILKSGKTVEAKIVEKEDSYIKVDLAGIPITYYLDDVESINGVIQTKKKDETSSSQGVAKKMILSELDTEHIHKILKHLGYPENSWPLIEQELTVLFDKIDFPQLRQEAVMLKSNPELLRDFLSKLGKSIEREGYTNYKVPQRLIGLLVSSLGSDDVFRVIEASSMSPQEKKESVRQLVSCSAITQLGSILLESLDLNTKAVFAPGHIFNCIPLHDQKVIFADFSNQIFDTVDVSQCYIREGKYMVLTKAYSLGPDKVRETFNRWQNGTRPETLNDQLNCFYSYIYITDDYGATPAIYSNRSTVHERQRNFAEAVSDGTIAIELNQDYAAAYVNRGNAYCDQGNALQAISDFNKAIGINPNFTEAYNNRGNIYRDQGDFSQAILDYAKAIEVNPNFSDAYTNRGYCYIKLGNPVGISDCTKAIELNPNDAQAHNNRALIYYVQKDFVKAWEDVHQAESLGYKVAPKFLEDLKKASGREK